LSNCVFARTLLDVPYFCQADPQWRGIPHLRPRDVQTENTIGKVGCALTSMAMIINYYADYHPDENMRNKIVKRNPLELNDLLVENKWYYVGSHDVDFEYIFHASSGAILLWRRIYRREDEILNTYLSSRKPVILKLYNPRTGNDHFVVVVGSCTSVGYVINEPTSSNPPQETNKNLRIYNNSYRNILLFEPNDGTGKPSALSIRGRNGKK